MRGTENLRAMLDRGDNRYKALVDHGHELGMEVHASIWMSDNYPHGL